MMEIEFLSNPLQMVNSDSSNVEECQNAPGAEKNSLVQDAPGAEKNSLVQDEIQMVHEASVSTEDIALAKQYHLPPAFFLYKNKNSRYVECIDIIHSPKAPEAEKNSLVHDEIQMVYESSGGVSTEDISLAKQYQLPPAFFLYKNKKSRYVECVDIIQSPIKKRKLEHQNSEKTFEPIKIFGNEEKVEVVSLESAGSSEKLSCVSVSTYSSPALNHETILTLSELVTDMKETENTTKAQNAVLSISNKTIVDENNCLNSSKKNQNINLSCNTSNMPPDANTLKVSQSINCIRESSSARTQDDMKILQKLSQTLAKSKEVRYSRNKSVLRLLDATKRLNVENCILFKSKLGKFKIKEKTKCMHECKIYFKNILISSVKHAMLKIGKFSVVESAVTKLQNLCLYEIRDHELKRLPRKFNEKTFIPNSDSSMNFTNNNSYINVFNLSRNINEKPADYLKVSQPINCTEEPNTDETQDGLILQKLRKALVVSPSLFAFNTKLLYSSLKDGFVLLITRSKMNSCRYIISESATFCKKKFGYGSENIPVPYPSQIRSCVFIDNITVGTGIATTIKAAKERACAYALDSLRKKYYILQVKDQYGTGEIINRDDIPGAGDNLKTSDIAEVPKVNAQNCLVIDEDCQKAKEKRKKKMWKNDIKQLGIKIDPILENFRETNSFNDLIFKNGFGQGDRKEIIRRASKNGLYAHSDILGNERFTIVRRNYSVVELLEHLMKVGGSDRKYELVNCN